MQKTFPIGILGAGLGSRMQSEAKAKPLAKLGNETLLSHLIRTLHLLNPKSIDCALRDELLSDDERKNLPKGPHYHFVNTDSSLHTLNELILRMNQQEAVLFTMADTIIQQKDLNAFGEFCSKLDKECAILVTPFVDDEKPLWIQCDSRGYVTKIGGETGQFVTSGMYFLSPEAMQLAPKCVGIGMEKMRNFLAYLLENQVSIKIFVVSKTIDVDHPSDLEKAKDFLQTS